MRRFGKLPLSVRELFFFLFFCICLRTIAESLISTAFQSYLCNNVFPDIHLVLWSFFCYFEYSLARFFFFAQWFSYFGRFRRKTSHGQMQLLSSKARSTMLTSGARAAAYRKKEVAWQYHGNHVKKSCLIVICLVWTRFWGFKHTGAVILLAHQYGRGSKSIWVDLLEKPPVANHPLDTLIPWKTWPWLTRRFSCSRLR